MASYRNTNGTLGGSSFAPRRSSPASIRSSAGGRPRSLGLYSPSSSPSPGSSPMSSSYLGLLGLGGYGSSASYHASPSSLSTYGGTASGYGGLTLPLHSGLYHTASSSSIGRSSSPSRSSYSSNSRTLPFRSSSFNRALTDSRVSQLSSAVPRSGSFTSLSTLSRRGSEGYSSGGELSGHSSRLSSVSGGSGDASVSNSRSGTPAHSAKDGGENGELDYKKLYEQSLAENDRLREKLKKTEDDLHEAKTQLDKVSVANVKNSSEMEKRERRAMERKLSEMEEELKQLQKLKAENERLKAENRALTRVVSKLTNSAHATK